ncbi:MAG: RMD1 family protein [Bacteroidetes bacterium]|nr:RMD1 family protein [Bacteroidota bacterium]
MKITAFYIAEQLDLKALKTNYAGQLLQENPNELFYQVDADQYFYAFDYGAVVFANMPDVDLSKNLLFVQQFVKKPLQEKLRDDFEIEIREGSSIQFGFDQITVPYLDEKGARIIMLALAHTVSLDFYSQRANNLLSEINGFTEELEQNGAIRITRKNMLKFIGRALNNKNRIVENLFIFDTPDLTWEDEYLDKLYRGLARTFELQTRFREIEYTFKVVEDNLTVFRELYLHRENRQLELIIIGLILVEVLNLLFGNALHKLFY